MGRVGDDVEMSSAVLYQRMAEMVWRRFNEKYPDKGNRDATFRTVDLIEVHELGQIQISVFLIEKQRSVLVLEQAVNQTGLLLLEIEGEYHRSVHLTFQEFFAAKCLARHLFEDKESQRLRAERFIATNRSFPQHETVLTFSIQELCSIHNCTGFDRLMQIASIDVVDGIYVDEACGCFRLFFRKGYCMCDSAKDWYQVSFLDSHHSTFSSPLPRFWASDAERLSLKVR